MSNNNQINRWLYVGFCVFGVYKLISGNFGDAAMYLGIALAFDPFDSTITWKERPLWQRIWTIVHLAVCAASFGFEIGTNDDIASGFKDGFNQK